MFISSLKKIFFLFVIILFAISANAQQVHFVYLQTESGHPFYVKFNHKVISSSSEGYIILPGIKDGDYQLVIGFPKNEFPEETFPLTVDKSNEGFLLKNFDEKGWQLFNLQTLALTEGTSDKNVDVAVKKDTDPFTNMLANVVKDSSILQNHETIAAPPAKKVDTSNVVHTDTSTIINNIAPSSVTVATPPSANKQDSSFTSKHDSSITRILDMRNDDGVQRIYADKSNNVIDTIIVFIPADKNQPVIDSNKVVVVQNSNPTIPTTVDTSHLTVTPTVIKPQADTAILISATAQGNETITKKDSSINKSSEIPQIAISSTENDSRGKIKDSVITPPDQQNVVINEIKDSAAQINADLSKAETVNTTPANPENNNAQNNPEKNQVVVMPKEVTYSKVNSDCKDFATSEDFLKLRKKMASESNRDDMLKVAKKYFKTKCFSTEQIKDLSYLFLTDEGKYMFFDMAYAFTSDSDQYPILQSQFTDSYYLNRFKAMIHQ